MTVIAGRGIFEVTEVVLLLLTRSPAHVLLLLLLLLPAFAAVKISASVAKRGLLGLTPGSVRGEEFILESGGRVLVGKLEEATLCGIAPTEPLLGFSELAPSSSSESRQMTSVVSLEGVGFAEFWALAGGRRVEVPNRTLGIRAGRRLVTFEVVVMIVLGVDCDTDCLSRDGWACGLCGAQYMYENRDKTVVL